MSLNHTKIEWALNPDGTPGYTWNPITGCLNGCPYCYARKLANGRLRSRYLANKNMSPDYMAINKAYNRTDLGPFDDPFYPRAWPTKFVELGNPSVKDLNHVGPPNQKGIFVCSMSDLFGIGVPVEWINVVMATIRINPQHRFYLLTKQPQNLQNFSPFPNNAWVGVSCTNRVQTNEAGFWLRNITAGLKFISFEPLLEHIPLQIDNFVEEGVQGLGWAIIGAQTNPYLCPDMVWVGDITRACIKAEIPVFHKDSLYMISPKLQQMPKEVQYAGR